MNIFLFELKALRSSFIIWTFSILLVFFALMTGIYPAFLASANDVAKVFSNYPPEFMIAFGFDAASVFSFGGFFTFTYTYLALTGAIMASSLALSTFSREKRSKCVDFLLTKPIKRGSIFFYKFASGFLFLTAMNLLFLGIASLVFRGGRQEADIYSRFLLAAVGLFLTQLVFYALGLTFAVFAKKIRSVSGIATAFGFSAFIISALQGILKEEALRYISPLKYFNPESVFQTGSYETKYALTGAVVFLLCLIISYVKFCRSDAHAV